MDTTEPEVVVELPHRLEEPLPSWVDPLSAYDFGRRCGFKNIQIDPNIHLDPESRHDFIVGWDQGLDDAIFYMG